MELISPTDELGRSIPFSNAAAPAETAEFLAPRATMSRFGSSATVQISSAQSGPHCQWLPTGKVAASDMSAGVILPIVSLPERET